MSFNSAATTAGDEKFGRHPFPKASARADSLTAQSVEQRRIKVGEVIVISADPQ